MRVDGGKTPGGVGAPTFGNGRYLVWDKLGEGGMASVYLAFDQQNRMWCALKVLLPQYSRNRKAKARFQVEAAAMKRIHHENIVQIYDVEIEGKAPYMVMELATGGCIVDWVEKYGPMPPKLACKVAIELSDGVQAAHAKGIVHRDIKPHNVLVSDTGQVKLTDFGIATITTADISLTKTGSVMGTLGYMAPEQKNNAKSVDARADVYSIGATLFTLLTGRTPMDLFIADQEDEMLQGVPSILVPVLLKACRYRPEERFQDAQTFASAMRKVYPALPPNPIQTPPIIMPFRQLPVDPSRGHRGSAQLANEIAERVELDTDPKPEAETLDEVTGQGTGGFLPYFMPSREQAKSERQLRQANSIPDYIDRDALDTPSASIQRSERPDSGGVKAPKKVARKDQTSGRKTATTAAVGGLAVLAPAVAFALLVVVGTLGYGWFVIADASSDTVAAQTAYYAEIESQSDIVYSLGAIGGDQNYLEKAYLDYQDATGVDKMKAAKEYTALIAAELKKAEGTENVDRKRLTNVQTGLERIQNGRNSYDTARETWRSRSSGGIGGLVVSLGIASSPQ